MFMLMFRCPQTGQTVSTGIYTDPDSFRRIPEALGSAYCPCCWLHHRWWPDDAWLADRPPAGPARSIDRAPKQLRAEARPMVSSLNLVNVFGTPVHLNAYESHSEASLGSVVPLSII